MLHKSVWLFIYDSEWRSGFSVPLFRVPYFLSLRVILILLKLNEFMPFMELKASYFEISNKIHKVNEDCFLIGTSRLYDDIGLWFVIKPNRKEAEKAIRDEFYYKGIFR